MTNYEALQLNFEKIANHIFNLKDRWADEREHEDFADYQASVNKMLSGFNMQPAKVSKTFALTFADGFSVKFYANGKVTWNLIGKPSVAA